MMRSSNLVRIDCSTNSCGRWKLLLSGTPAGASCVMRISRGPPASSLSASSAVGSSFAHQSFPGRRHALSTEKAPPSPPIDKPSTCVRPPLGKTLASGEVPVLPNPLVVERRQCFITPYGVCLTASKIVVIPLSFASGGHSHECGVVSASKKWVLLASAYWESACNQNPRKPS